METVRYKNDIHNLKDCIKNLEMLGIDTKTLGESKAFYYVLISNNDYEYRNKNLFRTLEHKYAIENYKSNLSKPIIISPIKWKYGHIREISIDMNITNIFIWQHVESLTNEDRIKERSNLENYIKTQLLPDKDINFLDTDLIDNLEYSLNDRRRAAMALEILVNADYIYFARNWKITRLSRLIYKFAEIYGIEILEDLRYIEKC